MKRLNFDVDDEFHAKLKAYCARKGVDMKEEVVELLSLVLEAQADQPMEQEGGEPYSVKTVEHEGEGVESDWKRQWEEYKRKYGGSSTDIDERLEKIEADIKELKKDRTELWNYINKRTEKVPELTETVNRIEKFLEENFG